MTKVWFINPKTRVWLIDWTIEDDPRTGTIGPFINKPKKAEVNKYLYEYTGIDFTKCDKLDAPRYWSYRKAKIYEDISELKV